MTMEEATELYGLMEGMLRVSEAARAAMARSASIGAPVEPPPRLKASPAPSSGSDEFFLLGILAMGAGAGLLAAMTKRLQDLPPATPTSLADSSTSKAKPR
jgi:hypothetical protein